jgi:hypothetical protein
MQRVPQRPQLFPIQRRTVPSLGDHRDRVLGRRSNSSGKLCSPRLVHGLHLV